MALPDALNTMVATGNLKTNPMNGMAAGVSVGIVNGEALWGPEHVEDSGPASDMNPRMVYNGRLTVTRSYTHLLLPPAHPSMPSLDDFSLSIHTTLRLPTQMCFIYTPSIAVTLYISG
ncbi:ribonuclease PH [Salmonella enterica]|nr:ribonuclease PH [Salmonella enterica]